MRPISHQLLSMVPAVMALALVLLSATPYPGGVLTYTPNVAWLMTLVMAAFYPAAWPRGLAFGLGFFQDILFGTPLGSQALLAMVLAHIAGMQAQRHQAQLFRLRWLEAAGMLVLMHGLLWAMMQLVSPDSASLRHLLRAGLINALWYPVFYWLATRLFAALPDAK
jgi:rod shape-determining protein MreD